MKNIFKNLDTHFIKNLIALAVPIALQNLITSSLNMVDSIMIGHLGENAIAGVGIANQIFFLLNLLLFGVFSAASIFASQFWGNNDFRGVKITLNISLKIGCVVSVAFTIISLIFSEQIIRIFNSNPSVIKIGSEYLRINALSYIIFSITFCYSILSRSTGNVKLPMFASIIALSINTILNYLLIYGNLDFPTMGTRGAAISTNISRIVELFIVLFVVYNKSYPIATKFQEFKEFNFEFFKKYFKTAVPVIMHESLWSLGMTIYTYVYGQMGVSAIASMNIVTTIEKTTIVFFFGISSACSIIVGKRIGETKNDLAYKEGKFILFACTIASIFISILLILSCKSVLSLYNVNNQVKESATQILTIIAILMPFRIANLILIVGIIRAGGDTTFGFFMEIIPLWLIAIPLVFLSGKLLGLPLIYVYLLACTEEFVKLYLGLRRFFSRKWINLVTN